MPIKTVDEFVKQKVPAELQPVATMLRELMRAAAPRAQEMMYYGLPMWKGRNVLCWLSPTKKDITFGFMQGVRFEDRYGLLRGSAKWARHVKIKDADGVNKAALRYYIRQALKLDKEG